MELALSVLAVALGPVLLATPDGKPVLIRDAKTYLLMAAKTAGYLALRGLRMSVGWHDGRTYGNAPASTAA